MSIKGNRFHNTDEAITNWMASKGISLLRISLGVIFLWFGMLKFFAGLSPAEALATRTIDMLTFGMIGPTTVRFGLAAWEVLIGIGLLLKIRLRETLLLMFVQMLGTMTPIVLLPEEVFTVFPYGLTLEGIAWRDSQPGAWVGSKENVIQMRASCSSLHIGLSVF